MNYQKIYDAIIEKAKSENRKKRNGVYYENHHIIPKCLNGSDEKENLVLLTAKEHFICHKLLIEIYPNNYHMQLAFVIMALNVSKTHQRIKLSSRDFEYARRLQVIANAEAKHGNKYRLGISHKQPDSAKKRISDYTKEHTPKFAFKKGQIPWNKGKINVYSEETKKKMGEKNIGKILTLEHREKISKKNIGKKKGPMTNEHRLKLGKSLRQYHDTRRKTKK